MLNKSGIRQTVNIRGDNNGNIYQTVTINGLEIKNSLPRLLPPVETYTGHENELKEVYDNFSNGKDVIILTGLGGIGKTEFAKKFGYKYFRGKSYYLSFKESIADTFLDLGQFLSLITVNSLGSTYGEYDSLKEILQKISCLLKKDELLVIDNVSKLDGINEIFQLPCHILLTTRLSCESVNLASCVQYVLPLLRESECVTMFYRYYNGGKENDLTPEEHAAVINIVKLVGAHTLTIELLAKTCAKACINVCEMSMRLEKNGFSLGGIKEKITQNNDTANMIFLEHLQKLFDITDILSIKGAKSLLKQLSVLRLEGLKIDYLIEILQLTDLNTLNELADYGWIRIQDNHVFMHNVVSQIINIRLKPVYKDLKGILKTLAVRLDNSETEIQEPYVEQSVAILQYMKNCKRRIICKIAARLGVVLYYKGRWNESEEYLSLCISGYKKCILKDELYLAEIFSDIGRTYKALAKYEDAMGYYNKSLSIRKKRLQKDDKAFVKLYNNMAVVYYQWDSNYEKTIDILRKAQGIIEKRSDIESEIAAQTYNYLGLAYRALGNYEMAVHYFEEKALPIQRRAYGAEAYQTAEIINNLAGVYRRQGVYDRALELYKEAFEIRKKILGEQHPDLATSYNNIGLLYLDKKEWIQSMEYLEQALSIYEESLGKDHAYTATVYHNIARVYMGEKDYSKAVDYEQMAVRIKEAKYTSSNTSLISSYKILVQAYEKLGNQTEAEVYRNIIQKQANISSE